MLSHMLVLQSCIFTFICIPRLQIGKIHFVQLSAQYFLFGLLENIVTNKMNISLHILSCILPFFSFLFFLIFFPKFSILDIQATFDFTMLLA